MAESEEEPAEIRVWGATQRSTHLRAFEKYFSNEFEAREMNHAEEAFNVEWGERYSAHPIPGHSWSLERARFLQSPNSPPLYVSPCWQKVSELLILTNWLVNMAEKQPKPTTHHGEQTRAAILQAAMAEFSRAGVAGARTDEIALAAGVNKALLYYYFKDKESLYGAVLDHAFGSIYSRLGAILDSQAPNSEKILQYAGEHFDALAKHPTFCRVVHSEMTRHDSPHMALLVKRYQGRLMERMQEVLREGIASGEFRQVDPINFALSMVAVNVFYFVSVPVFQAITGMDPLTPERIAARRAAVLDLISHALFTPKAAPKKSGPAHRGSKKEKPL